MNIHVSHTPSLHGEIRMPHSKTHSFRALVLAALASGTSIIRNPKISADWTEAVRALRLFGAHIEEIEPQVFRVDGVAGNLKTPSDIINVNNSGTMLFFIAGVAAACSGVSILTGDESIRTLRTISKNLIEPFQELGVDICSTKQDGMAPFVIKGPVRGTVAHMSGIGCQPVFSVLIACALAKNPVTIFVSEPGETAYIDLLLFWFKKTGISIENIGGTHAQYTTGGGQIPQAFDATIPLEWSAPSYPLLAALLLPQSTVWVQGMEFDDPYGDKLVIDILQQMGGNIEIEGNRITARSSILHGVSVDMNKLPDQVPTIAVAACFALGVTRITNVRTARWKECDRLAAITHELWAMGAHIEEKEDALIIHGDGGIRMHRGNLNGYRDHRMVLSLAVAGMKTQGETIISDAEMVDKSFETFIPDMKKAGAQFDIRETL